MINIRAVVAACFATVWSAGGLADGLTANWVPTAQGWYDVTALANWTDEGGAAVTRAPTNAADTLRFDAAEIKGAQTLRFPSSSTTYKKLSLGTLSGHANQTLLMPSRDSNLHVGYNYSIVNPNGFLGTFSQGDDHSTWTLAPTATLNPKLATLDTSSHSIVSVDGATGHAEIGATTGGGMLEKVGTGTLRVDEALSDAANDQTSMKLTEGTLCLNLDEKYPSTLAPADGAYIRLDASRPDTMTLVEQDGRTCVSEWRDADGRGIKATKYNSHHLPWLSTVTSVNGHPLVDFGAFLNDTENPYYASYWEPKLGPAASLTFDRATKVCEVFAVFEDTQVSNSACFVVGDTGSYYFHRESGRKLLASYYESTIHANDLTYIDGVKRHFKYGPYDFDKLCVVSMRVNGSGWLSTLANDRNNVRAGGCRIAEVIIYEKELTDRERLDTHRYLQAKWTLGRRVMPSQVATLRVMADGTTLDVPAGKTAEANALDVADGVTLTKTGDGAFNAAALSRTNLSVSVRGGSVSFVKRCDAISDAAPADDPQLWLDATVASSLVRDGATGSAHDYISRWNDRRADRSGACAYHVTECLTYPWVNGSVTAANGHPVVDFGNGFTTDWGGNYTTANFYDASYSDPSIRRESSYLALANVAGSYAGFVVLRMKMPNGNARGGATVLNPPLFGCSGQDFTRWNNASLISPYGTPATLSAFLTIDGLPYEYSQTYSFGTNDFHVVAISGASTFNANFMAYDRGYLFGGMEIGEMLLYSRPLSDLERKQTEAYLLKKWKNAAHPETEEAKIQDFSFASGVEPKLATDADLYIATLGLADGTNIVKSGAGKVRVGAIAADEGVASVTVREGALDLQCATTAFPDAAFHVDASVAGSFVFRAGQEADKRIEKWYDCRGNGKYAETVLDSVALYGSLSTNAVLKSTGDAASGGLAANRPYVDFETNDGMYWYDAKGARMDLSDAREYHVVFMITASGNHQPIGGWSGQYGLSSVFPSGGLDKPFWSSDADSCRYARDAAKKTDDGAWYTGNTWFPNGGSLSTTTFYVHSLAATNDLYVNSFAIDRNNCGRGSVKLCEAIVFTGKTNTTARAEAIHAYLLKKWKGIGAGAAVTAPVALDVAEGASLTLGGSSLDSVAVSSLAGRGTVTVAGGLSSVSALAAEVTSKTTVSCSVVNGSVTFADAGTLTLTVPDGLRLAPGSYTVFTATSISNFDPAGWQVVHPPMGGRSLRLVQQGNALVLEVQPPGCVLILR